ncbi:MAG: TetR/AcrR family transcriptional regulator [Actinomycetota bacterium]
MATRENQRERTRRAILDAAGRLVDAGSSNQSVDEIADEALVSRATVYRYFESIDDLLWQLQADRHSPDPRVAMSTAGNNLDQRMLAAEENVNAYLFEHQDSTRTFERIMLERRIEGRATDADRPGRRFIQIDAAIEPLIEQLPDDDLRLVRHALSLAIGSQSMVALLDTAGLDPDEARAVTRFVCRAIASETQRLLDEHALSHGKQATATTG